MFSRLKEAIDSRIQDEKDRQQQQRNQASLLGTRRVASPAPGRVPTRSNTANRPKSDTAALAKEKEKDPSEFEGVDLGGIDEKSVSGGVPSRSSTPISGGDQNGDNKGPANGEAVAEQSSENKEKDATPAIKSITSTPATATGDGLPADVKMKLRRLEKIESKYSVACVIFADLLRSYKIVHAKMQTIEPFEKALRENTPCTSIADPNSLVEYLNNLSLRSDLTMDEFKRVSREKDDLKRQLKESQDSHLKETAELSKEIETQKAKIQELENKIASAVPESNSSERQILNAPSSSPPKHSDSVGDIFSFEDERERLEAELEKSRTDLKEAIEAQAVAQDTVRTNLETVENAQKEVTSLKDSGQAKDEEIEQLTAQNKSLLEKVMAHTKELQERDLLTEEQKSKIATLNMELDTLRGHVCELEQAQAQAQAQGTKDKGDHTLLEKELESLRKEKASLTESVRVHEKQLERNHKISDATSKELEETKSALSKRVRELEDKLTATLQRMVQSTPNISNVEPKEVSESSPASLESSPAISGTNIPTSGTKKKRKGKNKGGKTLSGAQQPTPSSKQEAPTKATEIIVEDESTTITPGSFPELNASDLLAEELKSQLSELREQLDEKEFQLSKIRKIAFDNETLKDEVESLRDSLIEVGQEHVEAKDQIKALQASQRVFEIEVERLKAELRDKEKLLAESAKKLVSAEEQFTNDLESVKSSQAASLTEKDNACKALFSEVEVLKQELTTAQSDLSASEQLAAARFRDLTELKYFLTKMEQELDTLRTKVATLNAAKNDANQKLADMKKLERSESSLKQDVAASKSKLFDKEKEIENLKEKLKVETGKRTKAEESSRNIQKDLKTAQEGEKDAIVLVEKTSRELSKAQEEINSLRIKLQTLEKEITKLESEKDQLLDNLQLKTAQHTSTQSLLSSMQDQTSELAMQMKEMKEKCDSLEEELTESHRLLTERSRDTETMRRLLSDIETKNDARIREMREQMEAAFEERDKAEEEAATIGQKRAKELEELRDRVKVIEKSLRKAEEAKEVLENERTSYLSSREKAESELSRLQGELKDTKKAMEQMQDALDQTEAQIRAIENQKQELKKAAEQYRLQHERLLKTHKALQEELRLKRTRPIDTEIPTRSSTDSVRSRRVSSPTTVADTSIALTGPSGVLSTVNASYLKNFLLQFMEQKDKRRQQQLIPVLSQLLKFDGTDEQKWRAAVDAR